VRRRYISAPLTAAGRLRMIAGLVRMHGVTLSQESGDNPMFTAEMRGEADRLSKEAFEDGTFLDDLADRLEQIRLGPGDQRKEALALAALQAGIFPHPRYDDGKQWTYIARIYLFQLPDGEQLEAAHQLYKIPEERTEGEWFASPIDALAKAAEVLGLVPAGVPAPEALENQILKALQTFGVDDDSDWGREPYETAEYQADLAKKIAAALIQQPASTEGREST
jgi:hypothetical protein